MKERELMTEKKKLFNTTKLIEEILGKRGLIKRTVSESETTNNIFYGKMKTRSTPHPRSHSLTDLVGEMTINGWNSNSSFDDTSGAKVKEENINNVETGGDVVAYTQTPGRSKRQLSPTE